MSSTWLELINQLAGKTIIARKEIKKLLLKSGLIVSSELLSTSKVIDALDNLDECLRYLNTRRSKESAIKIENEADLQDFIFLMLRPWIEDLTPENPTDPIASRFVIQDFLTKKLQLVIEAKFIRNRSHGKTITKELHDDIETYRNHTSCSNLVFLIFDPKKFIPDVTSLKKQIEVTRTYNGKTIKVKCLVKS